MELVYDPSDTQYEACKRWADSTTEEIVFGGNKGGGKSNLGANCIFHDALVYPETRYFIARETLKDLTLYTTPTIHEVFKNWGLDFDKYVRFNGQYNNFTIRTNGSVVKLLECAHAPSDPLFERFGSMQWTRGWIEEGGEVPELAYTNLKLGIGRWNNDRYGLKRKLLITCNPKKNWIKYNFVDLWKQGKLPPDKAYIPSSVYDNKHRQRDYEKVLEGLTGTARQRLLLGEWDYDSDDDALIASERILGLYTNTHIPDEGEVYITVDVARFGKDKSVIFVWRGFRIIHVVILEKKDTVEVTRQVERLQSLYQVPVGNISVDDDGVGGGVVDNLPGCFAFVNNSAPLPNPKDNSKQNYDNLKSQCYYMLADMVNKGGIYIDFDLGSIFFDGKSVKQLLNQELEQVRRKEVDSDKKNGVLPKDKVKDILGRSPDYSDAMMQRMVFELARSYSWVAF
jgi:phage terminase large subunit